MAKTKAVAAPAARVRGKTKPEPVQKGILKKKPEKEPKKDKGKDPKSSKAPKSKDKKEKEERTDSFNCYTKMKTNSDYDPETVVKLTIELFIS